MTPDQKVLVEVVRAKFGEPVAVRFPEVWGPRVVVEAATAGGVLFVKASGDTDVRAEVSTLGFAAGAGVPVPRVLASGVDSRVLGGRWFAMSAAVGTHWSIDDREMTARVVPDLAHCFTRLHRVEPKGFGPLDGAGRGTFDSWPAWILETARTCLDALVDAGRVSDALRKKALAIFERATPTIERGSLMHADLGEGEMFIDPDRGIVTGIVDWGSAVVGDPVYELTRTMAGGAVNDPRSALILPSLVEQYVASSGLEKARIDRALPLYRAHNAICFAEWSWGPFAEWSEGEGEQWIDQQLDEVD